MKNNYKSLIAILLVLGVASYFALQNNKSSINNDSQLLIPELQEKINDVDGIAISKNDKSINLSKESGTWHIAEAGNYLADTNKIATLLLELRKLKLTDKKTSNPKNYKGLSLAEAGEGAATIIKLSHSGKQFSDVSIGKEAQRVQGVYVRINSEKQSWLASGSLDVSLEAKDWIVTTILDVDKSNIQSVTFSALDSAPFTIDKLTPNDKQFVIKSGMPEKMQLKTSVNLDELASGLQKFIIDSVSEADIEEHSALLSVVYKTFSGVVYRLVMFKVDEKYILTIELENSNSASDFDKKLQQWRYVIPSYKFDALNKKISDLIEPIVETKPDKEAKQQEKKD